MKNYIGVIIASFLIFSSGCKEEQSTGEINSEKIHDEIAKNFSEVQNVNSLMLKSLKSSTFSSEQIQKLDSIDIIAKDLAKYIFEIKHQLIFETGGIDSERKYIGIDRKDIINNFFIGENKNGKAYELQKKLNQYSNLLQQEGLHLHSKEKRIYNIALDGHETPATAYNPETKNKDFAQIYFKDLNLIEALALLSIYAEKVVILQQNNLNTVLINQLQTKK